MEDKLDFTFVKELDTLRELIPEGDEADEYAAPDGHVYVVDYELDRLRDLTGSARDCYTRYQKVIKSGQMDDFSKTEDMFSFFHAEVETCFDAIMKMIGVGVKYNVGSTYCKLVDALESELAELEELVNDLVELMAKRFVKILKLELFSADALDWRNKIKAEFSLQEEDEVDEVGFDETEADKVEAEEVESDEAETDEVKANE